MRMFKLPGASLLLAGCAVTATADSWEVRGDVPSGIYFWAAAEASDRLFLFGSDPEGVRNYTFELVPGATASQDVFEARAPMPNEAWGAVTYFKAAAIGGRIYVPGGGGPSSAASSRLVIYDPATDSWSTGPSLPAAVNNYGIAVVNGRLYVGGGCCGNRSDIFGLTPGGAWTTEPAQLSEARNFVAASGAAGRAVFIGGYIYPGTTRVATTDAYDPATGSSEVWPTMPTARSDHGAVTCGDRVYVVGGTPTEGGLLDRVEALDASTRVWSTAPAVPQMPHATTGECSALFRGGIWVFPFRTGLGAPIQVLHAAACAGNHAPVAHAGTDLAVEEGAAVTLDGTLSSDADGDTLSWSWLQIAGPTVELERTVPERPRFTAPGVARGGATLTFQLVVSDGRLLSAPSLVNVTVKNVNTTPVADAGDDAAVSEGAPVALDGTMSYDADGDELAWSWTQTAGPAVAIDGASTPRPTFAAPLVGAAGATLRFRLVVSDQLAETTDDVVVLVENVNHPPGADAGDDQTRAEASVVHLDASRSVDPDGDELAYSWSQVSGPAITLVDAETVRPHFHAPVVGPGGAVITLRVTVTDALGADDSDEAAVTVNDVNDPPSCHLARLAPLPWPPNHAMVVGEILALTDPENDSVLVEILSIAQDEPVQGTGDGDTSPDARIGPNAFALRSERSGRGDGRVYHVTFRATDALGQSCTATLTACVPHDRRSACGDGGPLHASP